MSSRLLPLVFIVTCLSACATQTPATFTPAEACAQTASTYESREVQCKMPANFIGTLRFKANFSGGHDDTVARLETFMNDTPLSCSEGSKTWLSAEEGDVSLWCDLSGAGIAKESVLKVLVKFSHAEYVSYELTAQ